MHLKGTEKKIIYLKSSDSRLFCEAFFVLREDAHAPAERDMLAEANRILDEHLMRSPRRAAPRVLFPLLCFFFGAALASLVFLTVFL